MQSTAEFSQNNAQPSTTLTQTASPAGHSQDPEQAPIENSRLLALTALNKGEKHWTWKTGLRVTVCILNIVAIGALAWLISGALSMDRLYAFGYDEFPGWAAGSIATFCLSFTWCFAAILIPFLRKPRQPLHPGIAVGVDLVFWLGFLTIALFTLVAVYTVASFGNDGYIQDPSYPYNGGYTGEYYLAPNNTWIYNVTYVRGVSDTPYYNATTGEYEYRTVNLSTIVRDCTRSFTTCQQQDQYINDVWQQKPRRLATTIVVNAVEWLNLLLHFALFVWACVDTQRYNARTTVRKEQVIADRIIADLEKKGLISVIHGIVQPARTGQPEMVQESALQHHPNTNDGIASEHLHGQ